MDKEIKEKNKEKKIWQSIVLEVDNVGVVLKQEDNKFFICISGTQEKVVDITDVFKHSQTALITHIEEEVEGMQREVRLMKNYRKNLEYNTALYDLKTFLKTLK